MSDLKNYPNFTVTAENLACSRGGEIIFSGLNFSVSSGKALIFRGPNGAGKSSALSIIGGFSEPYSGTLAFIGKDPEYRLGEYLHFSGHQSAVKSGLTVKENLIFWAAVQGGDKKRIAEVLFQSGLAGLEDFDASILSAGQTRRLALSRLLLSPRPIWLLDEPTSALDAQGSEWVDEIITNHINNNGLAIIATHLQLGIESSDNVISHNFKRGF